MLETPIATENIDYLKLNKEYLLQIEETLKDCWFINLIIIASYKWVNLY